MIEYAIQGLENGQVTDALTAYGIESAREKATSPWADWFDEIRIYNVTNPLSPKLEII